MRTAPASGRSNPAIMFISVDLPQPDGPTMATNSPSATVEARRRSMTGSAPLPASAKLLLIAVDDDLRRA